MDKSLHDILLANRDEVLRAARDHRAHNVRVFGSVVRSTERDGSDIDLLVDFESGASLLWDHAGLTVALQDLLGVPVDVVNSQTLREEIKPDVLANATPL